MPLVSLLLWKLKKKLKPFWRAGGIQAKNSTKFRPNGLCMPAAISSKAWAFIYIFIKINSWEVIFNEFMLGFICYFFFYQYIYWHHMCISACIASTNQCALHLIRARENLKMWIFKSWPHFSCFSKTLKSFALMF